jgi:hypothetical protein
LFTLARRAIADLASYVLRRAETEATIMRSCEDFSRRVQQLANKRGPLALESGIAAEI